MNEQFIKKKTPSKERVVINHEKEKEKKRKKKERK